MTLYYRATMSDPPTIWDSSEYEQANPLYTNSEGYYAWDVPEGLWQVKAELTGYQTAFSDWLPVPPPQTEVNLALIPTSGSDISTVWRFRNIKNGYYLWTASPAEKANIEQTLSATWVLEGVAYQIDTTNPANSSPLWRFVNIQGGYYLYSANAGERANINATMGNIWREEGEAYKVSQVAGGTTVWRFRNNHDGTYLYSASPVERANINATMSSTWFEEGTGFYVVGP